MANNNPSHPHTEAWFEFLKMYKALKQRVENQDKTKTKKTRHEKISKH